MDEEYVKKLVIARLNAMPPDIGFSIGGFGDYSRDQLIDEVRKGTKIGEATARSEVRFVIEMPDLIRKLSQ